MRFPGGFLAHMAYTSAPLEAVAAELAASDGSAPEGTNRFVPSFWAANRSPHFPPPAIAEPDEWDGAPNVRVVCTQTGLSARDQRNLVDRWCAALPAMVAVQVLWLDSRVPQELFDAACQMPQLAGLYLKWNGVKDLSSLRGLHDLRYLHLGASSSVESLRPLQAMNKLEWLQIESPTKDFCLEPLGGLSNLVGLGFTGVEGKKHCVPSLSPLSSLLQLRWLHLGAVHVVDGSLRPIGGLTNLDWLGIGNFFPVEELAWLKSRLPRTACDWLQPFCRFHKSLFPCRTCKQNWRVMTSGKGSKLLCPTCDSLKLAKHVIAYDQAFQQACRSPAET